MTIGSLAEQTGELAQMNAVQPYGDLLLTLTSAYDLRYNDKGSGAHEDGAFWHPQPQGAMRPVGSVVVSGYADLNGNRASLLVGDNGRGAVAAPVDYEWVWDDRGSGAHMDGSVWRPVAPAGYTALGDVANRGYHKPSLDDVWCVRNDLVATATYAHSSTWTDRGSGGDHDIAAWRVEPTDTSVQGDEVVFDSDSFIAVASYSHPPNNKLARSLRLPVEPERFPGPGPAPQLKSRTAPPPATPPKKDRAVILPFTCLFDPTDRASLDHIANPFCTVERWGNWVLSIFDDNTTDVVQQSSVSTTVGVTETATETFAHSTGIKVSAGWGVAVKFNVELNYQFTYTTSSSRALLESRTVNRTLSTPPQHAAAMWVQHFTFRAVRADGSSIGHELPFDVEVFGHSQFPEATDAGSVAVVD
jgi:hypothetical protein